MKLTGCVICEPCPDCFYSSWAQLGRLNFTACCNQKPLITWPVPSSHSGRDYKYTCQVTAITSIREKTRHQSFLAVWAEAGCCHQRQRGRKPLLDFTLSELQQGFSASSIWDLLRAFFSEHNKLNVPHVKCDLYEGVWVPELLISSYSKIMIRSSSSVENNYTQRR